MREGNEKRKKHNRSVAPKEDIVSRRLAAYGERFLSMFEDADERVERQADALGPPGEGDISCDSDNTDDSATGSGNGSSDNDSESDMEEQQGPLEYVFDNKAVVHSQQHNQRQQQQRVKVKQKPQADPAAQLEAERLERRAFMSSKAARVHSKAAPLGPLLRGGGSAEGEADLMSREEFAKMQREVELYGAAALDKKSRKRFEAAMLSKLGAKAQKSPRIPAKIGLGMARKAAQRDARALEEAIDAGMVKRKGLGRKKKEEKRRSMDRGLMEDRGLFRAGVMKVRRGGSKRGR